MSLKYHVLKLLWSFENDILDGKKSFEIRKNDRGFQRGDFIRFQVIDNRENPTCNYPIEDKVYIITYVMNGYGLQDGYVVLGIQEFVY